MIDDDRHSGHVDILPRGPLQDSPSVDVALALMELAEEPTCAASMLAIPHGLIPGLTAEAHRAAWSIMRRSRQMTAHAALASVRTVGGRPVSNEVLEALALFSEKLRLMESMGHDASRLVSYVLDDSGFGLEVYATFRPGGDDARTDLGCLRGLASRCRTLDQLLAAIDAGARGTYLEAVFDETPTKRASSVAETHLRPLPTRASHRAKREAERAEAFGE